MCGINGIFAYNNVASSPEEAELVTTRDAMRSRGPDGFGAWSDPKRRCALGHRRLSIQDLSDRASQPMLSEDGRLTVVFNGEIYNYPELRAEMESSGIRCRTTSDTEALLHLYSLHGRDMVHKLRGMYAFAIWDEDRRGLFLARDPYGIKPLYAANDGWTYRFASQVKALLAGGQVSHDPEPAGIVGFHLFGSVPDPFTLYREIRSLPAGHTQWVDSAGPREPRPFANLAEVLAAGAASPARAGELQSRIRTAALESVHAHLLADVEVGLFLSGGVDSGSLLGLMRDAGQRKIRAVTLAFEEFRGTAEDESPPARQISDYYGAEHIVRRISEREFFEDLPRIFDAMDQPSIDGVNTWFVAKAAREAGLKVALSGLGGDELFGGYPSYRDLPLWRRRYGPFAALPGLGRLARLTMGGISPAFFRDHPKALAVLEYADTWAGAYLLRRGLFLPHELPKIIDPEIAREGLRRLKPLSGIMASLNPDPGCDNGRVCALESTQYMRWQPLRDADWAGMAHSLEIRTPLVDFALLSSLAPSIPALTPGSGKAALAGSPRAALPNEILVRAKTGFGVPTGRWMETAADQTLGNPNSNRGLVSRRWAIAVLNRSVPNKSQTLPDQATDRPAILLAT